MGLLKSRNFWIGAGAGLILGPMILGKVAPGLKAKIPS